MGDYTLKPDEKILGLFIDPIEKLNVNKDTSCRIAAEAEKRGFKVFYFSIQGLSFNNGQVKAKGRFVTFQCESIMKNTYTLGEEATLNLEHCDTLLVRKDPPMNEDYLTATYLLELLDGKVKMVNHPRSMRSSHSKLQTTRYAQFLTPTLIAFNRVMILEFIEEYQNVIIKPVNGMGGKGIVHLNGKDKNLNSLIDTMLLAYGGQLIVQKYIKDIEETGDKRIILFDGDPVGAITKKAAQGDFRANLSAGATYEKAELSDRDREICAALKPYIQEKELFFVGLDVIGGLVTEINSISPGALSWANQVYDTPFEKIFWDVFERKYS